MVGPGLLVRFCFRGVRMDAWRAEKPEAGKAFILERK
jgi:hypothetical protein